MLQRTQVNHAWSVRRRIVVWGVLVLVMIGLFSCGPPNKPPPTYIPPPPIFIHATLTPTAVPLTTTPPPTAIPSPTLTPTSLTPITTPTPNSALEPSPISVPKPGLGVSVSEIEKRFKHDLWGSFTLTPSSTMDGISQVSGFSQKRDAFLHMLGPPDDLTQVSMTVFVAESTFTSTLSHFYAILGPTVPQWVWVIDSRPFWVGDSIRIYTETLEESTFVEHGKRVTLGGECSRRGDMAGN